MRSEMVRKQAEDTQLSIGTRLRRTTVQTSYIREQQRDTGLTGLRESPSIRIAALLPALTS